MGVGGEEGGGGGGGYLCKKLVEVKPKCFNLQYRLVACNLKTNSEAN